MYEKVTTPSIMEVISKCLGMLTWPNQIRFGLAAGIQTALAFLDLLGVAVIGLVGALSVSGVQSKNPPVSVLTALQIFQIEAFSFQIQVVILTSIATILLTIRTLLSVYLIKRIFYFLSAQSAEISSELTRNFLATNLTFVRMFPPQKTLFALTGGVKSITLGVLGNSYTILADLSVLLFLLVGLFIVDPIIAITTFCIFAFLSTFLFFRLNYKAQKLGNNSSYLSVENSKQILETLNLYKDIYIGNHLDFYARRISATRVKLSNIDAEMQFLPYVSKYVIESGIVLGAIAVAGLQFAIFDATQAISTLAIFMASASRIAPSILRLQQSSISLRSSIGQAEITFNLMNELKQFVVKYNSDENDNDQSEKIFIPTVEISKVSYIFPDQESGLEDINISIQSGQHIAFVGPSGAGKSTLVELMMGLVDPEKGEIRISGVSPHIARKRWQSSISYIPQEIVIIDVSLAENIALGFRREEIDRTLLKRVIEKAQLSNFVEGLRDGVETKLGDFGGRLSGGERQRIGIARALYREPKLIFMDEPTSALDSKTESEVVTALTKLKGGITVVTVAHRLSTVKNFDRIVYLEAGRIKASGSFDEVRAQIPDFDRQARLIGLT